MALKRKFEDFDVSEMKECSGAVVHGIITDLSLMKRSKDVNVKYFSGQLSDGKGSARVISLQPVTR